MYLFANWKMYLTSEQTTRLSFVVGGYDLPKEIEMVVFPNTLDLVHTKKQLAPAGIAIGAQNVAWVEQGAYTGAVSAKLFAEVGASFALVGHSERRYIFGEDDEAVRKKIEACLEAGLVPVVCVGETEDDKKEGKGEYRIKKQIMKAFEGLEIPKDGNVMVAYEPVWAIVGSGTGEACDPADVGHMHSVIRKEIESYIGDLEVPVLYGGSVDEDNIKSYLQIKGVDGVLVGSASTKQDTLFALVEKIEEHVKQKS